MAQVSWLYLDDHGGKHRVGLYHGDASGHLVIYCNLKVVQIDFHVKDSKKYTFFIEDDLIEIILIKEKTGFSYDFRINTAADTPKNKARKVERRANAWRIAAFFVGGLLLVTSFFFSVRYYHKNRRVSEMTISARGFEDGLSTEHKRQLLAHGKTSTTHIYFQENKYGRRGLYAFQTSDNQHIKGQIILPDTGAIALPTGFELKDRDEFVVIYLPEKPYIHLIRFDLPTEMQRQIYFRMAVGVEQVHNPEKSPAQNACWVYQAMAVKGWQVLADFIHQKTPVEKNPKNNTDSYNRIKNDASVVRNVNEHCMN